MVNDHEDTDDGHLLYVSTKHAREKLIISGHINRKKDGILSQDGKRNLGLTNPDFRGLYLHRRPSR
jgi:hypothetical protein